MHLLIVRHAIAVPHGTPEIADEERPLTDTGRRRFRRVAKGLARMVRRPDALLTSPLRRARQTAEILADAWKDIEPQDEPSLASGDFAGLEAALARYRPEELIVVVGHEPDLSMLVHRLVGKAPEQGMLKAMVVGVRTEADVADPKGLSTKLRFVLDPKTLAWQRE